MGRKRYTPPKPDGAICCKVVQVFDVLNTLATGISAICINWAGNDTAAATATARVTVQPEFTNMSARYNEYRVKGCKWEFVQMNQAQTTADTGFYFVEYGTDTKAPLPVETITAQQLRSLVDYKMVASNRTIRRYINVGRYWRKRNVNWLNTAVNYPDGVGTIIRLHTTGFAGNAVLARCMVTWYVEFKGFQI